MGACCSRRGMQLVYILSNQLPSPPLLLLPVLPRYNTTKPDTESGRKVLKCTSYTDMTLYLSMQTRISEKQHSANTVLSKPLASQGNFTEEIQYSKM